MNLFGNMTKRQKISWLIIPLIILMIVNLVPLFVMFIGSLKPSMALYQLPADMNPFSNISLKNFVNVMKKVNMGNAFFNSLKSSLSICVITLVIGMMGGYAFAKRKFAGKKILFAILLATMMLPRQIMMIPNYMVATKLNLVNSLTGLILTSVNCAYAIFLCKQFISSIPDSILEAARIDGCNEFRLFARIVLPLSTPVIGALFIFTFISSWNDFVWQNIMLTSKSNMTIPLALAFLDGQSDVLNTLGNKMAGATMSAIPMIIVFLCFQKYFVKGIVGGAVKE